MKKIILVIYFFVGFSIIGKSQSSSPLPPREINFKIKGTGSKNIIVNVGIGNQPGSGNCCSTIGPYTVLNFFGNVGDGVYDGKTKKLITKIHEGMDGSTIDLSKFYPMKGNDQDERIRELERKIAAMDGSNSPVPGDMAQTATNADPSTLGSFKFSEMTHNFGSIKEGQVIEHVFNFINTGMAPLVISNITSSCGCISPEWTETPVQPGKLGFVKMVFISNNKNGAQSPTVTIQANTNPSVTRLSLIGTVLYQRK
jgi:hypothetical protein